MNRLISVKSIDDIPVKYKNTPISLLVEYHNFKRVYDSYDKAQLLVGMCMDNRKQLKIPENFSYIIRTGGANMRYSAFKISYAIAIGKIKFIALIGHNNCGMVNLVSRKSEFIDGLAEMANWDRNIAEEHFMQFAPYFEIGSEIDFILNEVNRLRISYPNIQIAPMFYQVNDNKLSFIDEN